MTKRTLHFLQTQLERRAFDQMASIHKSQLRTWLDFRQGVEVVGHPNGDAVFGGSGPFDGAARQFFWNGYIEPYLDDLARRTLAQAREMADDHGIGLRELVHSAGETALSAARKTYRRMAEIDRRLLMTEGLQIVALRDWEPEYRNFRDRVAAQQAAVLSQHKTPSLMARLVVGRAHPGYLLALLVASLGALVVK